MFFFNDYEDDEKEKKEFNTLIPFAVITILVQMIYIKLYS